MKRLLFCLLSCAAMALELPAQTTQGNASATAAQAASSSAQNSAGSANSSGHPIRIAPGSVIPVKLMKTIEAKKAQPGEEVSAEVTQDLKSANGEIIVPKDARITGKVTEAQARNKQQKESELGIAFDHATLKDGADVAMPMSIQAVISPTYLSGAGSAANSQTDSGVQNSPMPGAGSMPGGGRSPGMGQQPGGTPSSPTGTGSSGAELGTASTNGSSHPPITQNTQGVLGIQHLELSNASNPAQGSVLTSDKNNVKLENGTLMLLRVNH